MILSGSVLAIALALVTAQGPRVRPAKAKAGASMAAGNAASSSKKKRTAPAPTIAVERRQGTDTGSARRDNDAPTAATSSADGGEGGPTSDIGTGTPAKSAKTKVYTFGAMDVEGKLKTPQLLYFLNRVKLELEMSAPDHRSFMKELQRSADDPAL